jgi:hypothetical protein
MVWAWLGDVPSCRRGTMVLGRLFLSVEVFTREPVSSCWFARRTVWSAAPPRWVARWYFPGGQAGQFWQAVTRRPFGPSHQTAWQVGRPVSGPSFGGLWASLGTLFSGT